MIERRETEGEREREKGRRRDIGREGEIREREIFGKSPKRRNKAQRKVYCKNYDAITISRNYYRKLSASILMTQKMWEL